MNDTQKLECFATVAQLKAALLFAGDKDVRYYLNGICVEHGTDGARLIATDGHRLIVIHLGDPYTTAVERECVTTVDTVTQYIIPRALIEQAIKAYARETQPLRITYIGTRVTVGELGAEAVDGKYPDIGRVVPSTVTGELAQYNVDYLADCKKARVLLIGARKDSPTANVYVSYNGSGPCLVELSPDAFAVVMSMRGDAVDAVPEWFARKAPADTTPATAEAEAA